MFIIFKADYFQLLVLCKRDLRISTEFRSYHDFKTKDYINVILLIRLGFKGTVVNRALQFYHGGSLEITRTVPFKYLSEQ